MIRIVMALYDEMRPMGWEKGSRLRKAQIKDEARIASQGDFSVAGLDNEARRAKPKGGNGRVKHSRSNAAVLSVLGGLAAGLAVSSLQSVCVSGTGKMGRPAAGKIRASRCLRNSNCHAATAMPCTTMGKSCWLAGEGSKLTGSGRGFYELPAQHASFKSLMPAERSRATKKKVNMNKVRNNSRGKMEGRGAGGNVVVVPGQARQLLGVGR